MSDFSDLMERAKQIRLLYAIYEKSLYGRSWSREEIVLGFMGDVGDLAKLASANEGVREIDNAKDKLTHELADCLWSLLVLADVYGVDLETAFCRMMDELEDRITSQ